MAVSLSGEPVVGIIMGSQSDWPTLAHAADILTHDFALASVQTRANVYPERVYFF